MTRTALFGAVVGFVAAAMWFLPRLGAAGIDTSTAGGALHLGVLLLVPSGTAALFAVVFAAFAVRFGAFRVAAGLVILNFAGYRYSASRRGHPLTTQETMEAAVWGCAMAAFTIIAARIMATSAGHR